MNILFYSVTFLLLNTLADSAQPYFPPQIVFSTNGDLSLFAIDEINQRAYTTIKYGTTGYEDSYVMKQFPYAIPDSPESKNYVQLLVDPEPSGCQYGTYWKYGGNQQNSFPWHWWVNSTSFEIKNYIRFNYDMIHSRNSSEVEDHWYSNETCPLDSGEIVPCQEIYFKKNTDIPLRLVEVVRRSWTVIQITINYHIISIGKPDEKYFDSIPKNWSTTCRDVNLGLLYYPQTSKIDLHQSVQVQVSLTTPPHRINGNDTVVIQWKASYGCSDCVTVSPKELTFNIDNFQERQNLTITRVKNRFKTTLTPLFNGGGFEHVPPVIYPIYIE